MEYQEQDRREQTGMWAILPAAVRYDKELPANGKLLYAEIAAKCNANNVCYMHNATFGELLGLSADTVSRLIKTLEKSGYIRLIVDPKNLNKERRIITLTGKPYSASVSPEGGIGKNAGTGKNADTVSAKMPRPIENNILENNPPIAPQGAGREKRVPKWKPERFEGLWNFYPRGEKRQAAVTAWDKAHLSDDEIDALGRMLTVQTRSDEWQRGIGIPYLSTYLNQRRWEEEGIKLTPRAAPSSGWAETGEVF